MTPGQTRPWLIIGGGLAAAEAATTLRAEGYGGRLVVVSDELHPPYERPPLSKDYLRGEKPLEKLYAGDLAIWDSASTELVLGRRAVELDVRRRLVRLDDGTSVAFDRLLMATGASPIRALPNAEAAFVHVLRTIDDADRLRSAAASASSAVVVGGGWIGAEVAASLRQMGLEVSLAISAPEVLEQRLGAEIGRRYSELHDRHGVEVVRGGPAVAILDGREGPSVQLREGAPLRADLVVLGLGARPNLDLAREAGLSTDVGVLADEYLETSVPGIFVAGDAAAAWHPAYGRHLRLEHWDAARRQGRTAAANLLGRRAAYDRTPYFYSDQFELGMEAWGLPTPEARVVLRELPETEGFVALWLVDGRVIGGLQANAWEASKDVRRLVEAGAAIDIGRFTDSAVPVAEVEVPVAA